MRYSGGLPVTGGSIAAADPVVSTSSDHATITVHLTAWQAAVGLSARPGAAEEMRGEPSPSAARL